MPKKRPFQFGMRTLLIAIFVFALVTWAVLPSRRERVIRELKDLGATVTIHERADGKGEETAVRLWAWRGETDDLRLLFALPPISHLLAYDCESFGDEDLALLRNRLSGVRYLELGGTSVADKGVNFCWEFAEVEKLTLDRTNITDSATEAFIQLPKLKELHLEKTAITDTSIPHLAQLRGLMDLRLGGTKISRKGYRQLRDAMPSSVSIQTPDYGASALSNSEE